MEKAKSIMARYQFLGLNISSWTFSKKIAEGFQPDRAKPRSAGSTKDFCPVNSPVIGFFRPNIPRPGNETKQQTPRCSLRSITDACGVKRSQQYLNLVKRSACRSLFCSKCPSSRFGPAEGKRGRKRVNDDGQAELDRTRANRERA